MALMITDECINCDVCEPECPNGAIPRVTRSTSSIRTSAPSASATSTSPSASRSARSIASPSTRNHPESKDELMEKFLKLTADK
jgi:ferredoxin